MKQYYEILGLKEGSTQEEIKKAYRTLSKKFHPDLNPENKESEEKFKKISEAYEILTGKQKPKNENPFGGGFRSRFKAKPLKMVLNLSLEEAYHGCKKRMNYTIKEPCKKCDGQGGFDPQICNQCGGVGHIRQGHFAFVCHNCGGNGRFFKAVCYSCGGRAVVNTTTHIDIEIPKGTTEDSIFSYPSVGDHISGGEQGDVYLIIKLKPHEIYQLEGLNLKRKIDVPLLDIILGTEKEFDTLDGKVKIKIPRLSELNKTFRLKGKGFVDNSIRVSGDLYVTLNPTTPKELTKEEEELINQLKLSDNFK